MTWALFLISNFIALFDLKTDESIATPCLVNTIGFTFECFKEDNRSQFVTSCIASSYVNSNIKSGGNLIIFLFTVALKLLSLSRTKMPDLYPP